MADPSQPQNDAITQSLEQATTYAPKLMSSPATAVTVASAGGNLEQSSQVVSHAQSMTAVAGAVNTEQRHSGGGLWGALGAVGHAVGQGVKDVGGAAMNVLNLPMKVAQHEFRYIAGVEQQHGWGAALGEMAAIAAGAVVGGVLTGGIGDVGLFAGAAADVGVDAAADTAAGATADTAASVADDAASTAAKVAGRGASKVTRAAQRSGFYTGGQIGGTAGDPMDHKLWEQTGASTWKDKEGNPVSFGRFVSGVAGLHGGAGQVASGALDGIFDLANGNLPGMQELSAARSTEGATGVFSAFRGYAINTDTLDYAMHNPGKYADFHRAMDLIANSRGAGAVKSLFPNLNAPGLIEELGDATTKEDVYDGLRGYVHSKELLNGGRLPTMGIFRLPFNRLRDAAEVAEAKWTLPNLEEGARNIPGVGRGLAPVVGSLSPATWARRFTHLPGMAVDSTGHFADHDVDFVSDKIPDAVTSMIRYGQGKRMAEHFGNDWVKSDPVGRQVMLRNAHLDSMFGMAGHMLLPGEHASEENILSHVVDPEARDYMAKRLDQLAGGFRPDESGKYGAYPSGAALKPLIDPQTNRPIGGGILLSQDGKGSVADFTEMKRMAKVVRGGKDIYGKLDDQAYRNFTQKFFKRFVLLSEGYVARISAAEDVANTLRLGVRNMVAAAGHSAMGRYGWEEFNKDDLNGLQTFVYNHFGDQLTHWGAKVKQWHVDRATELASMTGGTMMTDAVNAGHGGTENPVARVEEGMRRKSDRVLSSQRRSKKYTMFAPDDPHHLRSWRTWLGQIKKDPMSNAAAKAMHAAYVEGKTADEARVAGEGAWRTVLNGMTDQQKALYAASRMIRKDDPTFWSPNDSWAFHGTQNLIAATHNSEGQQIPDILRSVSMDDERLPHVRALSRVPEGDRPLGVPDRDFIADGNTKPARLATYGFDHIMQPQVNMMSRYSVMMLEYEKQYRILEPDITKGLVDHDEAMVTALARASQESTKWIHNLHDRTQWTATMRNWAPFWFAKEQAYRRMGRLLAEDPAAFQKYVLTLEGAQNYTVKHSGSDGQNYLLLPGEGFLSTTFNGTLSRLGIPIASVNPVELGGDFSASSVVFPFTGTGTSQGLGGVGPDFGPVALIPAKALYGAISSYGRRYSTFSPVAGRVQGLAQSVFGQEAMSEQMVNEFLPNTAMQRVFEAFQANDSTYDSVSATTLQTLDYDQAVAMAAWRKNGEKGPEPSIVPPLNAGPAAKQAFLSRVKNMTQMNLIGRALLSLATPVTLETKVQNFGFPQMITNYINAAGSVTKGMDKFTHDHPLATPYTVSQSTHPGSLATLPESASAQTWIEQNQALINEYPEAAIWLMPQAKTTGYSSTAYNEQIADNERVRDTPQQFLDKLYTAGGDQTYYAAYAEHKAILSGLGSNSGSIDNEYNRWSAYILQLEKQQPTWFANTTLFSPTAQSQAQQTVIQMKDIFAAGKAPKTPQSTLVQGLLNQYDVAMQKYAQANTSYSYTSQVAYVRDQWNAYLKDMKSSYPELSPLINSVFSGAMYQTT